MGSRLLHPFGVLFNLGEKGSVSRRGRRIRADAGERGHGRAYVGDDVVVAVLVANRKVRSVIGKSIICSGSRVLFKPAMVVSMA